MLVDMVVTQVLVMERMERQEGMVELGEREFLEYARDVLLKHVIREVEEKVGPNLFREYLHLRSFLLPWLER